MPDMLARTDNLNESPEEPYRRGLWLLPLDGPMLPITVKKSMPGLQDGPCELLYREQEMPAAFYDLAREVRHQLGVATRYVGFSLDRLRVSPDTALRIFGALCEAAEAHSLRHRAGECGSYGVDAFVDTLLQICRELYRDVDMRRGVHWYVDQYYPDYTLHVESQKEPLTGEPGMEYTSQSIEDACKTLLGHVPTFHIMSDVYDQCEVSAWPEPAARIEARLLPPAFVIAVDGETWRYLDDDPTIRAQTEWLLVDARTQHWLLAEHIKVRGINIRPRAAQVVGAVYDLLTGQTRAVESDKFYVPKSEAYEPWSMGSLGAKRLVGTVGSFLLLLQHESVQTTPQGLGGHWKVDLPADQSVDQIIADVLQRGSPSQEPSDTDQ